MITREQLETVVREYGMSVDHLEATLEKAGVAVEPEADAVERVARMFAGARCHTGIWSDDYNSARRAQELLTAEAQNEIRRLQARLHEIESAHRELHRLHTKECQEIGRLKAELASARADAEKRLPDDDVFDNEYHKAPFAAASRDPQDLLYAARQTALTAYRNVRALAAPPVLRLPSAKEIWNIWKATDITAVPGGGMQAVLEKIKSLNPGLRVEEKE